MSARKNAQNAFAIFPAEIRADMQDERLRGVEVRNRGESHLCVHGWEGLVIVTLSEQNERELWVVPTAGDEAQRVLASGERNTRDGCGAA